MDVPSSIHLRLARPADQTRIKRMVQAAHINPTGLNWQHFILATTAEGVIVGCGQIKPHRDGTRELASIVVEPGWRDQGIARLIIEHLLSAYSGTLYLTCRGGLEPFYNRFGFTSLAPDEMPPYYLRLSRLINALRVFGLAQEGLRVMRREEP